MGPSAMGPMGILSTSSIFRTLSDGSLGNGSLGDGSLGDGYLGDGSLGDNVAVRY